MRNVLVGNGINIQFGGYENTNESIIIRAIDNCKKENFPRHIIIDDPDLILTLLGYLFLEIPELLKDKYKKYASTTDEKESLRDLRKRYSCKENLRLTDIGFEDYLLIYDLFCHKNQIVNPDKYNIRESLKSFFLYSIYNDGKVNKIYKNFYTRLITYFKEQDNIFTTNYDKNIENFCKKKVLYLHGAFHIKRNVYNPKSIRNSLSDRPLDKCIVDENNYYLYSNALTSYSGYSKNFLITQMGKTNSAVEKFAEGYLQKENIKKDIDGWKDNSNQVLRNLYESIMLKVDNPNAKFNETYPINEFRKISGKLDILGL